MTELLTYLLLLSYYFRVLWGLRTILCVVPVNTYTFLFNPNTVLAFAHTFMEPSENYHKYKNLWKSGKLNNFWHIKSCLTYWDTGDKSETWNDILYLATWNSESHVRSWRRFFWFVPKKSIILEYCIQRSILESSTHNKERHSLTLKPLWFPIFLL